MGERIVERKPILDYLCFILCSLTMVPLLKLLVYISVAVDIAWLLRKIEMHIIYLSRCLIAKCICISGMERVKEKGRQKI